MQRFLKTLDEQRWDDHRLYHHSRINQSLHLFSALCFLCSYALLFFYPAGAALVGWLLAMASRQIGHFFFEPDGFDEANGVTHEYKEEVKVGYNLQRKTILLSIWALSPPLLMLDPTVMGLLPEPETSLAFLENLSMVWIAIGVGAVLVRTIHLIFLKDLTNALAWMTKILTDPFHDIKLYHRAPMYVWRGEMFDPITPDAHGRRTQGAGVGLSDV